MTLPLRKKLPTTVQTIRSGVTTLKRTSARGLLVVAVISSCSPWISAQAPQWQPSRLTPASNLPTLPQSPAPAANATSASGANASGANSGVVLRWRRSERVSTPTATQTPNAADALAQTANHAPNTFVTTAAGVTAEPKRNDSYNAWSENPLRDRGAAQPDSRQTQRGGSPARSVGQPSPNPSLAAQALAIQAGSASTDPNAVRWTAYQTAAEIGRENFDDPNQAPAPQLQAPAPQLQAPPLEFVPPTLPPTTPPAMPDPLSRPEQAPPPPRSPIVPPQFSPAAPAPSLDNAPAVTPPAVPPTRDSAVSPFDSRLPDNLERGSAPQRPDLDADLQKELGKMAQPDDLLHCEQFRDQLRNSPLNKINLNSAPHYGQGLNVDAEEEEKMRLDFAANSERRQWCDRDGRNLITGRLIDLRHEQVVLDVDGVRREVALRDLCDVDLAYIGKAWNLPVSCGTGIDAVAGRSFVPSAVQWKAAGLCHKPLYFEEVQLERYGHDLGPVLQPIASTVHFFGNIAVLPYKMGIHPPHECQYSLGYYRPGSCAPYMVPPVPISLRGAATQAIAVTGAAAIIP